MRLSFHFFHPSFKESCWRYGSYQLLQTKMLLYHTNDAHSYVHTPPIELCLYSLIGHFILCHGLKVFVTYSLQKCEQIGEVEDQQINLSNCIGDRAVGTWIQSGKLYIESYLKRVDVYLQGTIFFSCKRCSLTHILSVRCCLYYIKEHLLLLCIQYVQRKRIGDCRFLLFSYADFSVQDNDLRFSDFVENLNFKLSM